MKRTPILLALAVTIVVGASGFFAGRSVGGDVSPPRIYELRIYTTLEGRFPALQARFRDHTLKLFEKHGMKNVIYLTPVDEPNKLVYLLAHKDKASRDASFDAFRKDPAWIAARDASEKDGKIVEKVESVFLEPTGYSPVK